MLFFLFTLGVFVYRNDLVEGFSPSPSRCYVDNLPSPSALSRNNDRGKRECMFQNSLMKDTFSGTPDAARLPKKKITANTSDSKDIMVSRRCQDKVVISSSSLLSPYFCDEAEIISTTSLKASRLDSIEREVSSHTFSYGDFAKQYPFVNNMAIATTKAGAADFVAQTIIGHSSIFDLDIRRSILFMLFGAAYSGGFQWVYQIQIFKRLFDIETFTNLSLKEKLQDKEGLQTLAMQIGLDLIIMTFVYLPTFYIFKAAVLSGSNDPSVWFSSGFSDYILNFSKDESDALTVWFPADLICFSVPLYLRLPVRHSVSFLWTTYISFSRGAP